jgi:hypothetical protein
MPKPVKHRTRIHKLEAFLARDSRIFVLTGALIVFGTFVLKSAIREDLKDLIDTINSAQDFHALQQITSDILAAVNSVYDAVGDTSRRTESLIDGRPVPPESDLKAFFWIPNLLNRDCDDYVSQINRLLERLPYDEATASRFNTLKQRLVQHHQDYEKLIGSTSYAVDKDPEKAKIREQIALVEKWADTGIALQKLNQDVLSEAEQLRIKAEHRYKIFRWISYGVYTLGWGLALVGRLFGAKTFDIGI